MIVRIAALLLIAAGPAWSQPREGRRGPPPSAYAACDGASEGADCSFQTPRGRTPGACYFLGDRMACIPADAPRPPARNAPPPREERGDEPPPGEERAELPEPPPARTRPYVAPPRSAPRLAEAPELARPSVALAPMAAAPAAPAAPAAAAAPAGLAETVAALPVAAALAPAAAVPATPEPPRVFPYAALLGLVGCFAGALALWRTSAAAPTAPAPAPQPPTAASPVVEAPPVMYVPPASTEALPPPRPVTPAPAPAPLFAAAPTLVGAVIGTDYVIRREIGAGGMGVVYEAMDLKLDRRVALKKMRAEISQSARGRERFLSEARLVAKLQHPNIVTIHGIIEEPGGLYLVFEYVDGETLDDLLGRHTRLTSEQALAVLKGVSEAVDHAHEHKVIHRDLKPANIMIDKAGHVKVMDFGIAHQAKITVSQFTVAEAFGTMAYMPPEQELGKAVRESDVYAFAALTYESLTGTLPFPGPNFHLQKEAMSFTRPSGNFPPLSTRLDPVFERAFQVEPKKRYPTTGEFVRTLQGALQAA